MIDLKTAPLATTIAPGAVLIGADSRIGAAQPQVYPASLLMAGAVSLINFGAVGDGVADDTVAVQAAFDYVKTNGGTLVDPAGSIFRVGAITLNATAKPWRFRGVRGATKFVRKDDTVGTVFTCAASSYPFELRDFVLDCKHATFPNGNHGISIADTNGVRVCGVDVVDWKNSAILVYSTVANAFGDCIVSDCTALSAANAANNGILIVDMYRSGFIACAVKGATGSPGYGIQLKNDCRYGFVTDGYAESCVAGLAFGQDSGTGVSYCSVKGMKTRSCTANGAVLGRANYNRIDGLQIDMGSVGENAIDLNDTNVGNVINASVRNLAATKGAVRMRTGSVDNAVVLGLLDNINSTGKAAIFDSGSARNTVNLLRAVTPTLPATGAQAFVTDNSTTYDNAFNYEGFPNFFAVTLASDVAVVKNPQATVLQLETEASAALDDLVTITGKAYDGAMLLVRTASNLRDVVVKTTGNITLTSSAELTLLTTSYSLLLRYNASASKWVEVSRSQDVPGRRSLASFGAVGSGSTNDAAAIQAAFNSGLPLWANPGTYRVDSTITLPANTDIEGVPGTATFTKATGATHNLFAATSVADIRLVGIGFDGKRRLGGGVTGHSALFTGCTRVRVEGCKFYDGWNLTIDGGTETTIVNNSFQLGKSGIGLGLTSGSATTFDTIISGNHIRDMEDEGIDSNFNVKGLVISNNWIYNCHATAGGELIDIGGGTHDQIVVADNVLDANSLTGCGAGIRAKLGVTNLTITGNTILNGDKTDTNGRAIDVNACSRAVVANNVCRSWRRGITMSGTVEGRISGNHLSDCNTYGIYFTGNDPIIEGNTVLGDIAGAASAGIELSTGVGFLVANNKVRDWNGAGINIASTVSDGRVIGNDVSYADDGILLSGPRVVCEGNATYLNKDTGITINGLNQTVSNNLIYNNSKVTVAQYGLLVNGAKDYAVITGNQVFDNQGTKTQNGIRFSAASDRCILANNMAYSNLATNLSNVAALTNSLNVNNITA